MAFLYDTVPTLVEKKRERWQRRLQDAGIDAVVLFDSHSVRYLTDFFVKGYRMISMDYEYVGIMMQTGRPILGYLSGSDDFLVANRCGSADAYRLPLRSEWAQFISDHLRDQGVERGVVATDMMPFDVSAGLASVMPGLEIVRADIWADLTSVKLPEEIELVRRATDIACKGMKSAVDAVRVGVSELDIAIEAEYTIRKAGSEVVPYIFQVASGSNSAIFERISTDRRIEIGDLVVIDVGATVGGYLGEFARTVVVGDPTPLQRDIANVQLAALSRAKEVAVPGVRCDEVDEAARRVIIDGGYGKYMHRFATGHQLGYGTHGEPPISKDSSAKLEKDMIINLEPRINFFDQPLVGGVVNEDTLLILEDGNLQLTQFPYDAKLSGKDFAE